MLDSLGESMLTTHNYVLVPHVPEKGFQDYLFHHLPRDQGDVDQPVVLQILFLEERSDICYFPAFFGEHYSLSKNKTEVKKSMHTTFISQFHTFSSSFMFLSLCLVQLWSPPFQNLVS